MNKHDLRIVKTKKNIHRVLLALLKEKPLSQITVTELCRLAEISRGTFYFHYEEIGDILDEMFEITMQDLEVWYKDPFKKGFNITQKNLAPGMIQIFNHVKKNEDFYRIILSSDVFIKYYYLLYENIMRLHKDFSRTHFEQNKFFLSYSANGIIGLIIEWYKEDFHSSEEEMNNRLYEILQGRDWS